MREGIHEDDLSGADIRRLVRDHLVDAAQHAPPESTHALDVDALRGPDITFFSAWRGGALAGCGALRELDRHHGEIKSMRTAPAFLRQGVASTIVEHLIDVATARGYARLSLETGAAPAFAPARALYARHGFAPCAAFGRYVEDHHSVFMTYDITSRK